MDCAIAAAMYSINTEPGVCALAGSAYVSIWLPGDAPITIDGNVAVPGLSRPAEASPTAESVSMGYGGGIETLIGVASVAVPGTPAALHLASQRFGHIGWRDLLAPVIRATRSGFPLSAACHYYLKYSGDIIFGHSEDGHSALHDREGDLLDVRNNIIVPHLADSLTALAEDGSRVFYQGEIAQVITDHIQDGGGLLTMEDLKRYQPLVRDSLIVGLGNWKIATNPPPAVGGVVLAAMLLAFDEQPITQWDGNSLQLLLRVQQTAMSYRKRELDLSEDVPQAAARLLELARSGELLSRWSSGLDGTHVGGRR